MVNYSILVEEELLLFVELKTTSLAYTRVLLLEKEERSFI